MKKLENQKSYIDKIKPVLRKSRFSQINMDDMARHMDISKVTLYKYFSSKDEIIEMFVDHCVEFLRNADGELLNEEVPFAKRFQKTYEQSLKCVIYVPDILLQDLREVYPALFDKLFMAQQTRYKNLQRFLESGMDHGEFNRINAMLFIVQDEVVLRHIVDPAFSIQYDLTLKQSLLDFYTLKKYQIFKPELLAKADDTELEEHITQIIQTISR